MEKSWCPLPQSKQSINSPRKLTANLPCVQWPCSFSCVDRGLLSPCYSEPFRACQNLSMIRFLSQDQNAAGVSSKLSFLEERDHRKEGSKQLRISLSLGSTMLQQLPHVSTWCYRHNYALGADGILTVRAASWAGGLGRDRWSGAKGYSCISWAATCLKVLCCWTLELSPRDPNPPSM